MALVYSDPVRIAKPKEIHGGIINSVAAAGVLRNDLGRMGTGLLAHHLPFLSLKSLLIRIE